MTNRDFEKLLSMKFFTFFTYSLQMLFIIMPIILPQGSIITPDDPQKDDFMSNNSTLIWGILIAFFLIATFTYLKYAARKRKQREEEDKSSKQ